MKTPFTPMDDSRRLAGRSGSSANGRAFKDMVTGLNAIATRQRPLFTWVGGPLNGNTSQALPSIRANWLDASPGRNGISTMALQLPTAGPPVTGQGATIGITGAFATTLSGASPYAGPAPVTARLYPEKGTVSDSLAIVVPKDSSTRPRGLAISSDTTAGPQLRAGMIWESNNNESNIGPNANPRLLPTDWESSGQQISGRDTAVSDLRSMRSVRNYLRQAYKGRRIHFGWCAGNPDNATTTPINVAVGPGYILNQIAAYTATGPGMRIPLRYAASGINTRVRLYFSVYARMNGGGTGGFTYYGLDDFGAAVGPTAMAHSITVSGSTWQWYGQSDPFNEATGTYLLGNATLPFDNIQVVGSGANLNVGAFMLFAYHSQQ